MPLCTGSGLDEVAIHGETIVAEIKDGKIHEYTVTPADFGLNTHPLEAIKGGEPEENKAITTDILTGSVQMSRRWRSGVNVASLCLFGRRDPKANVQTSD